MLQRFLDPQVLASIGSLDLIAKTVVDGFVNGLHRSPSFGFSQEFAEYRQYVEGDDLRHVDWNVYARTDRIYLKRFKGETNSQLLVLLDTSASMSYGTVAYKGGTISKLDYARFIAASLVYLSSQQRDASGIIVFDEDVRAYVPPSTRQGQLVRLLHTIEQAEKGARTDFVKPFELNYTVAFEPDAKAMGPFDIAAMPTSFVVDKQGVVRYAESSDDPKQLPNFEAIRDTLAKLK